MRKAVKLLVAEALTLVIGIILFGFVILSWYIGGQQMLPSIYTLVIWLGVFLIGYSFIAIIITLVMLGIAQIVELIRTRGKNSIQTDMEKEVQRAKCKPAYWTGQFPDADHSY